jgi:hypothetical protein
MGWKLELLTSSLLVIENSTGLKKPGWDIRHWLKTMVKFLKIYLTSPW